MNKIKRILKRFLLWIGAAALMILVTACGQKQADTTAMRLDTVQMVETAAGDTSAETADTLRERLDAPDVYAYEAADGVVTLTANAPVSIPDVESVPMVKTSGADFTQEQIDVLLLLLWEDDAMWNNDQPLTKSKIEQQITSIECSLQTNADYQDEREYYETVRLPELREMLKTAPEEVGSVRSDGKLVTESILDGTTDKVAASVTGLSVSGDTGRYFWVRNNADNTSVLENTRNGRLSIQRWAKLVYRSARDGIAYFGINTMFSGIEVTPDDRSMRTIDGIGAKQSPAQAASAAEDFLSKLGEDLSICDMYLMNSDGRAVYMMRCVRNIQGVPCIMMEGESAAIYVDSEDEELPDAVWAYETVTLFVDESGVCQLEWASPHRTGETLVEDCKLLPFPDIADVCSNMLPLLFHEDWGHIENMTSATVEIDRVEFGMLRVVENQSVGGGLMIPVWAFYGKRGFIAENQEMQNRVSQRLLIVNAVDGSVVDPDKGL